MGCGGGHPGTPGTRGGITRWIIPALIAPVLAILRWSALSGRGRSCGGTQAPASSPSNRPAPP